MSQNKLQVQGGREAGQASPFTILVAALLGVLVLALLCTGGTLLLRDQEQADFGATSTAIAVANATTIAENARVTQTIAAMETEAARPTATSTATPRPTNTATATPTNTPSPTATEAVAQVDDTPTPNIFGTSIFEGGTPTTGGVATGGTGTGGGTLPQTGAGLGTAVGIALLLLLGLAVVRRLRTS
jgi:hypothetical protein